jgi:broad specificity phosphatase PhoE
LPTLIRAADEPPTQKWPDTLWIVRHGESAANVARGYAYANGLPMIDVSVRDMDVPLSDRGERQAEALGHWFGQLPAEEQPSVVLCSTYTRARSTAEIVCERAGLSRDNLTFVVDERLREREFGIFDRLTNVGIEQRFPEQAALKHFLGKFYHRPPGGESWSDVILRLRSVIDTITREYRGERVMIVCHSVVVLCFRYLLERMTEEQILEVDRGEEVANCSVTQYAFDPTLGREGKLVLRHYNFVAPLEAEGAPVTSAPDVPREVS